MQSIRRVGIFCGSHTGHSDQYLKGVKQLARALAQAKLEVIYGGAQSGLMGALADEMLACGGIVRGILPRNILDVEQPHPHLTE